MADVADGQHAAGTTAGQLTGGQVRQHRSRRENGGSEPAARRAPRPAVERLAAAAAAHGPFTVVVLAAAALRAIVMLGYPPILWYSDSYTYIADAVTKTPDLVRSDGYPLFLYVLLPFHSLTLIAGLQAAMGLAMGIAIYAVLRHRGLPWWGATLAALPVLFDVFELQLEHMVMSDVLFIFLVTVAIAALCWSRRPPMLVAAVAGLMIGYAATVRSVGLPLLAVAVVGLALRRAGWRPVVATAVAGIAPIAGYMVWFHGTYGRYAMDESMGAFLYSRVSAFADCSTMKPPPNLRVLCDPRPPGQRPNSQQYLWSTDTPLWHASDGNQFSPATNALTKQFAERAILAQPLSYLNVVAHDTERTFEWRRVQSNLTGSGWDFRFTPTVTPVTSNPSLWWVTYYPQDKSSLQTYAGPGLGQPAVVQPYAGFLQGYEKYVFLRGTILAVIVLAGALGAVARWRQLGGMVLLPWAAGVLLIVLPPMTAGFSYRYVLAAVPAACLAAGLAFTRERGRGGRRRARSSCTAPRQALLARRSAQQDQPAR